MDRSSESDQGYTLWRSDGTPEGTMRLGAAPEGGRVQVMECPWGGILFPAYTESLGRNCWHSDGTPGERLWSGTSTGRRRFQSHLFTALEISPLFLVTTPETRARNSGARTALWRAPGWSLDLRPVRNPRGPRQCRFWADRNAFPCA